MMYVPFLVATSLFTVAAGYCNITIGNNGDFQNIPSLIEKFNFQEKVDDLHVCFQPNKIYNTFSLLNLNGKLHNHPNGGRIVWRPTTTNTTTDSSMLLPILSAGAQVNKWYRCNDGEHCPGLEWQGTFVAYNTDIKNITSSFLPVRNLWINGSRASRVSIDGNTLGWTVSPTGFVAQEPFSSEEATSFVENQVELVWPRVIKNWIQPRCTITAVSGKNITINPTCWKNLIARNGGKLPPVPTFVENIVRPPSPGEFTSTVNYIFYKPFSSDPYAVPINAWVPTLSKIMTSTGLTNYSFESLQFSHATWRIPSSAQGYVPTQTLVTSTEGEPVGAVEIILGREITFRECVFKNIGAAYGLSIGGASQHVIVDSNHFYDLSGGALKIGNVLNTTRALTTNTNEQDLDYTISNNIMESVAIEYSGGACIFAGYIANTTIEKNTISNTGYTGISLGWGWGSHVKGPQTYAADNHITSNRLLSVMSNLNDGGCTYTLGPQPRSTVSNNYCSMDSAPVVGCFYHDNGSRYFTTTNNVCNQSPAPCVYLQGCCNAPAYDISVSNLWCRGTAPVRNGCEAENCTIDAKTLYMLKEGTPWPKAAQSIVDASGVTVV